jgi:hypothetical protein
MSDKHLCANCGEYKPTKLCQVADVSLYLCLPCIKLINGYQPLSGDPSPMRAKVLEE